MKKAKRTPVTKKNATTQPAPPIEEVKEPPQKRQKVESPAQLIFTRKGKVDFTPLYKQHKSEMIRGGCQVDQIIKIRQKLHSHPEGGFKEFKTQ
jgi:amidohydrolase